MSGIVVGIDGSHNASMALDWAMEEAALRKADLKVITVNPVAASTWTGSPMMLPGDQERTEAIRQAAEESARKAAAALGDQQPRSVSVVAVNGFPAATLVTASKDADLMVVGGRGAGGFGELFLGSVTSQLVHHAKCPVVVIPDGRP